MKDLIKAQLYQISRTRVYYLVAVFLIAMAALFGAVEYMNGADELEEGQLLTASDFFTRMTITPTMALMGMTFLGAFICGDDFFDKTMNYELTSGRLRKQAFLSRVIVTLMMCTAFGLLMMITTIMTADILNGWGSSIPVSAAVTRTLLCIFPFIRYSCFVIMLSYIIKRPGFTFLACYGILNGITLVTPKDPFSYNVISLNTISEFMHFKYYCTFGLARDAAVVYTPEIQTSAAVSGIVVSLAFSALYLLTAYSYFHKDDIE